MPTPRKRRSTTEVNLAGDRWKRKAVNVFGSINASSAEAVPVAIVHRRRMVLEFADWTTFIKSCRTLEREISLEFFSEEGFEETPDEHLS